MYVMYASTNQSTSLGRRVSGAGGASNLLPWAIYREAPGEGATAQEPWCAKLRACREGGVRLPHTEVRSTADHLHEVEVDPKRRRLGHELSDLARDA